MRIEMDMKAIVEASMSGARINQGADVVLYLDPAGTCKVDGRWCFLPVMAIEGSDGYAEFLPRYRDEIAGWFGDDEEAAQEKVDEINRDAGYEPEAAIALVGASMARAAERDHSDGLQVRR
jgi:hypothetical protein